MGTCLECLYLERKFVTTDCVLTEMLLSIVHTLNF